MRSVWLSTTQQVVMKSLQKRGRLHRSRIHGLTFNSLREKGLIELNKGCVFITPTQLGRDISIQCHIEIE